MKRREIRGYRKNIKAKVFATIIGAAIALSGSASKVPLKKVYGSEGDRVPIVLLKDIADDEYENGVPAIDSNGETVIIDPNTVAVIDENLDNDSKTSMVYTISPTGEMIQVEVSNEYLSEACMMSNEELDELTENTYEVTGTGEIGEVNVRNNMEVTEDSKIGTLPEGARVLGGSKISSEETGMEWVPVLYTDSSGKIVQAYIAGDYLRELGKTDLDIQIEESKPEDSKPEDGRDKVEEVMSGVVPNRNGSLTGIDVSSEVTADALRSMLLSDSGISESVTYRSGANYDTGDIAGKISYVYIEIGASGYVGGTPLEQGNARYIEQAQVCEELGVPYGFYYFSQAIEEKEAEAEVEDFKRKLAEFKSQTGELHYMVLPPALDVESGVDRYGTAYRVNGHNVTDAVIRWIQKAEEDGLGMPILYTTVWDVGCSEESMVNADRVNSELGRKVPIWIVGMRTQNGGIKQVDPGVQARINDLIGGGGIVIMKQSVIDCKNAGTEGPYFDIDDADPDSLRALLEMQAGIDRDDEDHTLGISIQDVADWLFGSDDEGR